MAAPEKAALLARAIRLEWLTIGWTAIAGAVALVAGLWAHSVSLHAFALDSAVECVCAGVLIVRLRAELLRHPDAGAWERIASAVVGVLLLAAAVYITAAALQHLRAHRGQDVSLPGMALTIATIPVMLPLAHHKLAIARLLPSRALRADAVGNAVCWYLAAVVLAGLAAQVIFTAWWLDGAASLAVVALLLPEGWQALRASSQPRA